MERKKKEKTWKIRRKKGGKDRRNEGRLKRNIGIMETLIYQLYHCLTISCIQKCASQFSELSENTAHPENCWGWQKKNFTHMSFFHWVTKIVHFPLK
jgi:hypothetical protein